MIVVVGEIGVVVDGVGGVTVGGCVGIGVVVIYVDCDVAGVWCC